MKEYQSAVRLLSTLSYTFLQRLALFSFKQSEQRHETLNHRPSGFTPHQHERQLHFQGKRNASHDLD